MLRAEAHHNTLHVCYTSHDVVFDSLCFIDTFEQVPLTSSQLCVRRDDCLQDYASDNDEDDGPRPTDPPTTPTGLRVKTKRVRPVRFLGRCCTHLCDKEYGVVVPGERVASLK
jgi:hypothetical protein